jgi:hypothetical protein
VTGSAPHRSKRTTGMATPGRAEQSRKLTVEQVLDARLSYAVGDRDWSNLARKYGVNRDIVRSAALGLTYKHLPMPPRSR